MKTAILNKFKKLCLRPFIFNNLLFASKIIIIKMD